MPSQDSTSLVSKLWFGNSQQRRHFYHRLISPWLGSADLWSASVSRQGLSCPQFDATTSRLSYLCSIVIFSHARESVIDVQPQFTLRPRFGCLSGAKISSQPFSLDCHLLCSLFNVFHSSFTSQDLAVSLRFMNHKKKFQSSEELV